MLTRELRDEIERNARRKRDRLVFLPYEPRQRIEELMAVDDDLVMVRFDRLRRETRIRELVAFTFRKTDRECLDRLLDHRSHQSSETCRIDSAGQEQSKRNVAHQMTAHAVGKSLAQVISLRLQGE